MFEVLQYDFMINAILASLLASIACGIIGTYIVIKRLVFLSGGIAHSAYGGIGLGYLLSFNPIIGAVGSSVLGAIFISKMRKNKSENEDTSNWNYLGFWNGSWGIIHWTGSRLCTRLDELFIWEHSYCF